MQSPIRHTYGYKSDIMTSVCQAAPQKVPQPPRKACARDETKTRRTCALVKREDIWQRQHMGGLGNGSLAIRALSISKHAVAGLVGTPRWCGGDDASKLGTEYERARRLRLVLSLGLQYLFCGSVCQGNRRRGGMRSERTSKKLSPALCTSIRSSSEPGFGTGSGASRVSWILDGCAYSVTTRAFIIDLRRSEVRAASP
jgi:hypothetical protein